MALMSQGADELLTEIRRTVTALENRIRNLRAMHRSVVEGRGNILRPNFRGEESDKKAA